MLEVGSGNGEAFLGISLGIITPRFWQPAIYYLNRI